MRLFGKLSGYEKATHIAKAKAVFTQAVTAGE